MEFLRGGKPKCQNFMVCLGLRIGWVCADCDVPVWSVWCSHHIIWLSLLSVFSVATICHLQPNLSGPAAGKRQSGLLSRPEGNSKVTRTPPKLGCNPLAKRRQRSRRPIQDSCGYDGGCHSFCFLISTFLTPSYLLMMLKTRMVSKQWMLKLSFQGT